MGNIWKFLKLDTNNDEKNKEFWDIIDLTKENNLAMPTLLRWLKEEESLVSVSLKDIKSEITTKIKEQNNNEEAFNEMKQEFEKTR